MPFLQKKNILKLQFLMVTFNNKKKPEFFLNSGFAGNQTRTGTPFDQRGILSPLCLPFHHPGGMNHYIIFSQFIQVGNLKTSFKNSKMSFRNCTFYRRKKFTIFCKRLVLRIIFFYLFSCPKKKSFF